MASAVALLVLLGVAACGPAAAPGGPASQAPAASATTAPAAARETARAAPVRRDIGFRTPALFEEHYLKHGREFGSVSRAQYLRIAQQLRECPAGGDVLELVRADGVVSRFDRGTGTFIAFNSNGVIRTCFRPSDGERYFRRQALR